MRTGAQAKEQPHAGAVTPDSVFERTAFARHALTLVVIVIGATIHLGFLLQVFSVKSVAGLAFPLVVSAPWLLLYAASRIAANRAGSQYVSLFASVLYLCLGGWAYWDTLYIHPDPQGGLVFLVFPVAGAIGASILLGVLLALRGRIRSRGQSRGDA